MHDYIFYSIAAIIGFVIYLDLRRSEKKHKSKSFHSMISLMLLGWLWQSRTMEDDSIILDISRGVRADTSNRYYCSHCNTRLVPRTGEDMKGGYLCTKCIITYWPNQTPVKKANRFDVPRPTTDTHGNVTGDKTIPIAVIDLEDTRNEIHSTSYKHNRNSQKRTKHFRKLDSNG